MSILSDHITECPACHTEIGVACTDVAEAERLRAEVADLRRRVRDREARIRAMLVAARMGSCIMKDGRDWYISELADLHRPLPRRGQ